MPAGEDGLPEFRDDALDALLEKASVPLDEFPQVQRALLVDGFPSNYIAPGDPVACTFCGKGILKGDIDPVSLRITARADRRSEYGAQVMYCHATCLAAAGCQGLEVTEPHYWDGIDEDEAERH